MTLFIYMYPNGEVETTRESIPVNGSPNTERLNEAEIVLRVDEDAELTTTVIKSRSYPIYTRNAIMDLRSSDVLLSDRPAMRMIQRSKDEDLTLE